MLMEGHIWMMQGGGMEKEEVLGTALPSNPQYNPNSTTILLPL